MDNFRFKKKYGQNFLRDNNILDRISKSFNLREDAKIVEIGPGDGALTKKLVLNNNEVFAFEIDESLKPYLDRINKDNLKVIFGDFLEVNLYDYFKNDKIYVVANVPYYITTPIITKFLDENVIPEEMVLMVQKEVALRLSANPGNKEYGAISVILNYYFDIEYLFTVSRNCFYPVPNVESAVIKLSKKEKLITLNDNEKFKKIVNDAFKQKRKTIKNNLLNYNLNIIENILNKYNLSLNSRAEEISYEIYVEIANNL